VEFVPILNPSLQAPHSVAFTDEKGHYRLTCENEKPGAVIGPHRVVIVPCIQDPKTPGVPPNVPVNYTIASQSPLAIEVTETQSVCDLELKTPP
jgi:hypothetical protein